MEAERHIEMTWRCATCEHRNLGRHKTCQACGKAKDPSVEYEMPEDPASAASVTDVDLLRMATAGPDWRCAYCNSAQRRSDNGCANCGASIAHEVPEMTPVPVRRRDRRHLAIAIGIAVVVVVVALITFAATRRSSAPATVQPVLATPAAPEQHAARVTGIAWENVIEVERYALHDHDGFDVPTGALSVHSLGQRVHHHDNVLDHYDTEHYTEQVPDGYRTETYSARESCGQDCTTRPQSCRQQCTPKKNGFASCRQVCSGGGRSCSTRYCNVTKTRQVPKTRTESRTRQVPRYRDEPRYAEAFAWQAWEWASQRTLRANGTDVAAMTWPDNPRPAMGSGEDERERKVTHYTVTLAYDDATGPHALRFEVPQDRLAAYQTPDTHVVERTNTGTTVDGVAIVPLPGL